MRVTSAGPGARCAKMAGAAVLVLLSLAVRRCSGQDDGGDLGGGEDMMDMESMMGDTGDMGAGVNGGGPGGSAPREKKSLRLQTLLALKELGVVIGVFIMVAASFMLMVFTEKIYNSVLSKYHKRYGEPPTMADEDPAKLVGTFKRYKN